MLLEINRDLMRLKILRKFRTWLTSKLRRKKRKVAGLALLLLKKKLRLRSKRLKEMKIKQAPKKMLK